MVAGLQVFTSLNMTGRRCRQEMTGREQESREQAEVRVVGGSKKRRGTFRGRKRNGY